MSEKKVIITTNFNDLQCELPVLTPTLGREVINIQSLPKHLNMFTHDQGFKATSSCESKITFIKGAIGELLHRGYPIEELSKKSNFLSVSYLLYNGELPSEKEFDKAQESMSNHSELNTVTLDVLRSLPQDAHPMSQLGIAVSSLSSLYYSKETNNCKELRKEATDRLRSQVLSIAGFINRKSLGIQEENIGYSKEDTFSKNFIRMFFGKDSKLLEDDIAIEAIDKLLILHADHEQNASTSTVRLAGSTGTDPYAAISTGISALWGPAHGGANEAVLEMLNEIGSVENVEKFISRAKDKNDTFKLMGFGHRVYKNFDPRAQIIQKLCSKILESKGNDPRLALAKKLEEIALSDEYFIERKLYPNVDFYSGIIYSALGIPVNMFTVIFAVARTAGWVSHWNELLENSDNIGRPRQLYSGSTKRSL